MPTPPGTWQVKHSRNQPELSLVYGVAANDIWGVGYEFTGTGSVTVTVLYRWQGTRWNRVQALAAGAGIVAMWGASSNDVWAVGPGPLLVHHFDGTSWSSVPNLPMGVTAQTVLRGVWGRSATEVYAVGRESSIGAALILKYDGTSWQKETFSGSPPFAPLFAIAGNATEVLAAGATGLVLSRVAGQWATIAPTNWYLGGDLTNLVSLPNGQQRASSTSGDLYAYAGGTWSFLQNVGTPAPSRLWAASNSELWFASSGMVRQLGVSAIPLMGQVLGLFGAAPNDAWATGRDAISKGVIFRYDGQLWSNVIDSPTTATLSLLSGRGPNDLWAAGGVGLLHFDGTAWSMAGNAFALSLFACGPNEAWVGGYGGTLQHQVGTTTTTTTLPGAASGWSVDALWGTSCSDFWVGGTTGGANRQALLYHFVNGTLTPGTVTYPATTRVKAFIGFAADDIWATNDSGQLIHYDGAAWAQRATAVPAGDAQLGGSSATDLWASKCDGAVCRFSRWNGSAWTASPDVSAPGIFVSGLAARGPADAWATANGASFFFDGVRWSLQPAAMPLSPVAIWASAGGYWSVGVDGAFLYHP